MALNIHCTECGKDSDSDSIGSDTKCKYCDSKNIDISMAIEWVEKTDDELKELARDILTDRVFTDGHVENGYDCFTGFMLFCTSVKITNAGELGMIYEYYSKAAPRSCNGRPIFFSHNFLRKDQAVKVWDYQSKMRKALDEI